MLWILKRINNYNDLTFKDAYYALGLLDDDKKYVDAINDESIGGMPLYRKQLFARHIYIKSGVLHESF